MLILSDLTVRLLSTKSSPPRCSRFDNGQAKESIERNAADLQDPMLCMMEVVATRTDLADLLSII